MFWTETRELTRKLLEPVKLMLAKESAFLTSTITKTAANPNYQVCGFYLLYFLLKEPLQMDLLNKLRQQNPVVLTVANMVTPSDVANGLNILGASPIMSKAPEEATDMVKIAQAVTINLGTVDQAQHQEMISVMDAAEKLNVPAVFDPVACASSKYRATIANELLNRYSFAVIRGNAGEIAALTGSYWQSHGIDAGKGNGDLASIAKQCARKYQAVVAMTGNTDIITDGQTVTKVPYGSPLFAAHVGTGDMLSSIIAAFISLTDDTLTATTIACQTFALAGEIAAQTAKTPSHWYEQFMDNLYLADKSHVEKWQKLLKKEV